MERVPFIPTGRGKLADADDDFLKGGYARLWHFNSLAWKKYAEELGGLSDRFNSLVWSNNATGYHWPMNPLHTWSRIWEYPFAAAHLQRIQARIKYGPQGDELKSPDQRRLRVLDVGAAVTFFSAYLAEQEIELTNFDNDQSMLYRFEEAFGRIADSMKLNEWPRYVIGDARDMELPDHSFDVVLCISVLEHIPSWELAVSEFVRVLRPGGLLILTFDVKDGGNLEGLSRLELGDMLTELNRSCVPLTQEYQEVPVDVLHMYNSIYPIKREAGPLGIKTMLRPLKQIFVPRANLNVFGGMWQKSGGLRAESASR